MGAPLTKAVLKHLYPAEIQAFPQPHEWRLLPLVSPAYILEPLPKVVHSWGRIAYNAWCGVPGCSGEDPVVLQTPLREEYKESIGLFGMTFFKGAQLNTQRWWLHGLEDSPVQHLKRGGETFSPWQHQGKKTI